MKNSTLLALLINYPQIIPAHQDLLADPFNNSLSLLASGQLQLAIWKVLGTEQLQVDFHMKFPNFCCQHHVELYFFMCEGSH